jgi:transposase
MDRSQGKPLSPDVKECIVLLKQYFDRNRPTVGPKDLSAQMVADALNVGLATVNRVMASYNKDPNSLNALPKIRGRPDYAVDASLQESIRAYIRAANMKGVHITLEAIREFINDQSADTSFHIITLGRTLERWGFEFGKGIRTQHLKEKDYVIAARHRYLRKMRKNRSPKSDGMTIRPEVYLDESYVNKNHSNDFIWYSSDDGPWVQKPTGNGERFIIVNAITRDGWVPEAKLVFKSTKKTGDYHGQMNSQNFKKWFTDKLIPNIPVNSMIIMDNASYHSMLSNSSAPTSTCSKKRIQEWLEANKCHYNPDCLKSELIELLSKMVPEPSYEIDEIARQHGHEVVRTPPYHPELQPIEICWGVLKNEIARNCNFTMKNLEIQLESAFNKVTGETCKKIIKGIRSMEDKFWEEDAIMDEREEDSAQNDA